MAALLASRSRQLGGAMRPEHALCRDFGRALKGAVAALGAGAALATIVLVIHPGFSQAQRR